MRYFAFVMKWIVGFIPFLLGLISLLIGGLSAVFTAMVLLANDGRASQVLGRVWFEHDPFFGLMNSHSIQLAQVVIERKLGITWLWTPHITNILNQPSWLVLSIMAVVFLLLAWLCLRFAAKFARLGAAN